MERSDILLLVLLTFIIVYLVYYHNFPSTICATAIFSDKAGENMVTQYRQKDFNKDYDSRRRELYEDYVAGPQDWTRRPPEPARKSKSRFTNISELMATRSQKESFANDLKPVDLLPAFITGNKEKLRAQTKKFDWVERFNTVTEGLVKGKNFLDHADLMYQSYINPRKKNMNIDIRGGKEVKIHPEFGLWLNRPDIPNQDADLTNHVLCGKSSRGMRMARESLQARRAAQNQARRLNKYGKVK